MKVIAKVHTNSPWEAIFLILIFIYQFMDTLALFIFLITVINNFTLNSFLCFLIKNISGGEVDDCKKKLVFVNVMNKPWLPDRPNFDEKEVVPVGLEKAFEGNYAEGVEVWSARADGEVGRADVDGGLLSGHLERNIMIEVAAWKDENFRRIEAILYHCALWDDMEL